MTSINGGALGAGTIGGVFAAATRNANRGGDVAVASGQVIAKRVTLGMMAALNPLRADHVEFARMVPEKVEAFSAAGRIMAKCLEHANRQTMRFASDEVMMTASATITMAGCSSPAAVVEAQGRLALKWFDWVASNCIAMGMLALDAQDAVMTPIRQTVIANSERLKW